MRSINQVRHFYVANSFVADAKTLTKDSAEGAIAVVDGLDTIVFKYKSPGGLETSDVIKKDNILSASYTLSADMNIKLKGKKITLAANPVAGQEYIIKVLCKNYAGAGDDNYTVKYGMAVATSTDDKASLITKLAVSLEKNLKDLVPLFSVTDDKSGNLIIQEVLNDYELGVKPLTVTHFDVEIFPIVVEGVETMWAVTDDKGFITDAADVTKTVSGYKVADMEWFHTGARGDMYRGYGHPHGVRTKLLADVEKLYDVIDIHYAYVGPNEGAQKSEKTISIAAENAIAGQIKDALTSVFPAED